VTEGWVPTRHCGAVIFDLDGVLIDSEGLQYAAYTEVLARYGVAVTAAEYGTHWIATGRGPEYAVERFQLPLAADELRALKRPVYERILREAVRLMPGARETLGRVHAHFPLAVATNSLRTEVEYVLAHFGCDAFFSAIVAREDYRLAKPSPDAYLTAAGRLGVPPSACLIVEDAQRGVLAADAAGATVVAVPNEFTRGSDFSLALAVLRSLDELTRDRIEAWFAVPRA